MLHFYKEDNYNLEFCVTHEVHSQFMNIFKDCNPLHSNIAFAREKGFKSEVMHGNILNGFVSYFIGECLPIKNVIIHSQEIVYKNAVYLDDLLSFDAVVTETFDSVNAVEFKFNFKNAESKVVAKGKIQIGILT